MYEIHLDAIGMRLDMRNDVAAMLGRQTDNKRKLPCAEGQERGEGNKRAKKSDNETTQGKREQQDWYGAETSVYGPPSDDEGVTRTERTTFQYHTSQDSSSDSSPTSERRATVITFQISFYFRDTITV